MGRALRKDSFSEEHNGGYAKITIERGNPCHDVEEQRESLGKDGQHSLREICQIVCIVH